MIIGELEVQNVLGEVLEARHALSDDGDCESVHFAIEVLLLG